MHGLCYIICLFLTGFLLRTRVYVYQLSTHKPTHTNTIEYSYSVHYTEYKLILFLFTPFPRYATITSTAVHRHLVTPLNNPICAHINYDAIEHAINLLKKNVQLGVPANYNISISKNVGAIKITTINQMSR